MTASAVAGQLSDDERIELFKALADPVRLDILARIAAVNELPCTALVEDANVSASTVSYHVKNLKSAGLVAVRKEGRNYHYTLQPAALTALSEFLTSLGHRVP